MTVRRPKVVVVGGGLSGLATAWFLRRDHPDLDVEVRESSDHLGGKLRTASLAGEPFDVGADAFLARQPEFADLCVELGLGDQLVAPVSSTVWIWLDGVLRPLPSGTTLGIPGDATALEASGILSEEGFIRAQAEAWLAPPELGPDDDPPVAEFVAQRFGVEVVDRLVDPLLSGIYAGSTSRLGLRSAAPAIASLADVAARTGSTMTEVARLRAEAVAPDPEPVFKTVRDGLEVVIQRLADGLDIRTSSPVEHLAFVHGQWQVDGDAADAVVFATPAWATTRIIATGAPQIASLLDRVEYASATVVALAYPSKTELPEGSGMLVPRGEERLLKAATWSSRKWPHLADRDHVLLRCSMGRIDDHRHDLLSSDEVVERTREELGSALGIEDEPVEAIVARWPRALPQYDAGHRARVAEIQGLAEDRGLVLTGAAFDGVGLPACVRQAASAARQAAGIALA